jgi:hypothetical protein
MRPEISNLGSDLQETQADCVSGRAMFDALVAGERDPEALANMVRFRLRAKIPELSEALTGRCSEHHAFSVKVHFDLIGQRAHHRRDHRTRRCGEGTVS